MADESGAGIGVGVSTGIGTGFKETAGVAGKVRSSQHVASSI